MDRCEVEKLFTLFSQFWPNKQVTAKMKLAWEIALEPYGRKSRRRRLCQTQ